MTLTEQQTLIEGDIVQNETHTVLSFVKLLEEPGEISIDPNGENWFLVAAGSGNTLAYHAKREFRLFDVSECGISPAAIQSEYAVGDVIESAEFFVMDRFCIEQVSKWRVHEYSNCITHLDFRTSPCRDSSLICPILRLLYTQNYTPL